MMQGFLQSIIVDPQFPIGKTYGQYLFQKLLGVGGFANAYLVFNKKLKRQETVKILREKLTQIEVEKFNEEALLLASLRHTNIVMVLDTGVIESVPFYAMQYARRGCLADYIEDKGQKLSFTEALTLFEPIGDALSVLHEKGLVHCDIKAENILLDIDSRGNLYPLLSDFGLTIKSQTTTLSKIPVIGTPDFMPYEQLIGKPTRKSDQFALAVLFYWVLTKEYPVDSGNALSLKEWLDIRISSPIRSFKDWGIVMTFQNYKIEQIIRKALSSEQEKRYSSVNDFINELKKVTSGSYSLLTIDQLLKECERLRNAGLYTKALGITNNLLTITKSHVQVYFEKGLVLQQLGKYQEAISVWDQVIKLSSSNSYAHNNKGWCLLELGYIQNAIPVLDKAIQLNPKNSLAFLNKSYAFQKLGMYREAIPLLDKVIQLEPTNSKGYNSKGYSLLELGQYRDAISFFDLALRFDPANTKAIVNRTFAYNKLSRESW